MSLIKFLVVKSWFWNWELKDWIKALEYFKKYNDQKIDLTVLALQ